MGKKRSSRRSRWGIIPQLTVLFLVIGMAGAMAIQPTRQLFAQRDRISDMSRDLREVTRSNRALEARVQRLKNPDYLEQQARETGLIRPGETVYNVVPPSRKEQRRKEQRTQQTSPRPVQEPGFMERFLSFVGLG